MRGESPTPEFAQSACAALNRRDAKLLDWITRSNVATLVADSFSVKEYTPAREKAPRASWPLHEHCLFKLGMPFGELWRLTPLAKWLRANGRSRLLLTAPPLRLRPHWFADDADRDGLTSSRSYATAPCERSSW